MNPRGHSKLLIENLNPLSSKGRISFSSFALSLFAIVVFNLIVWAVLKQQLIPARAALDRDRTLLLYGLWFLFATIGFASATNTFIKRWAGVFGDREISGFWKFAIRFALLSPLLAYPLTVVSFAYHGLSRRTGAALILGGFVLSIAASPFLPRAVFGIERIDFLASTAPLSRVMPAPVSLPGVNVLAPSLATATPGLRYLFWLGTDAYRSWFLSRAVAVHDSELCKQRLGFLGLEVRDCYFANLRKMALEAPLVSPFFALYFESLYRQKVSEEFQIQQSDTQTSSAQTGLVLSLLTLSNQIELLEPSPMFVERTHFLSPAALLHAYGSPEFPLVEAGQDVQRFGLVLRLLPVFEMQLTSVQKFLSEQGRMLGAEEVTVTSEVADLRRRIDAIKRDPLLIAR